MSTTTELKQRLRDAASGSVLQREIFSAAADRIEELERQLASFMQGVKISVPTQTMEQEFQSHYRRGYEAGRSAAS